VFSCKRPTLVTEAGRMTSLPHVRGGFSAQGQHTKFVHRTDHDVVFLRSAPYAR